MTKEERDALVESVAGAWRPRDADGQLQSHPAWHDLDPAGRQEAAEVARRVRAIEAGLDPRGLSTTVRAVLARIRGGAW